MIFVVRLTQTASTGTERQEGLAEVPLLGFCDAPEEQIDHLA